MSKFDVTEDTTTPNATVGTKLSDISSTDNKNTFNVTDRYADTNKDGARTPIYGQSLFTGDSAGRTAALAYAKTATFDPTSTTSGNVSSGTLDSDGKILKTGKYYQTITYKLANDTDKAIEAMLAGTKDDSTNQKVSPYSVFINGGSTAATDGTDYAYNKNTGTITVLRPINVMDIVKPELETPNSSVGELASSLKDTTGDKLIDDNGQTVPTSDVNIDDTYYTDKTVNNNNIATGLVGSDGKFTKAGTYWRKITFTLSDGDVSSITNNGGAINATGKQLTYVQEVDIKDSAKLTVADATANAGELTSVESATTGNDVTGKDGSLLNQDEGDYKGVSFGTDYYDVNSDNVSKSTVLNGTAGSPTSGVVTDGKFTKAGTYLRTITFYLIQGAISNNAFTGLDPDVKEIEKNSTVMYVQTITINPHEVIPTINDVHTMIGTSVTANELHDPSTVELPGRDNSLLNKTEGDNKSGISFGNTYYDDSTLNNVTKNISAKGRLNAATTYHRLVTFYLTDAAYNQFHFNGSFTHSDKDESISYMQDVIVDPSTKTATFGKHDLDVTYNTATNSSTLTETSDYTLADDDGNTGSIEDNASLDGKYYATEAEAKAGTNALTVANLTNFLSPYYRVITIKVKSGDGYLYSYPGASFVDADNDKVQYIQKISVNKEIATINVPSESVVSGSALAGIKQDTTTITDSSSNSIGTGVAGTTYYDDPADAINNSSDTSSRIITDRVPRVTGPNGTMYRTITFTLNSGAGSNYTFKGADGDVEGTNFKIDSATDTITYAQPISITLGPVSEINIVPQKVNVGSQSTVDPTDITVKIQQSFFGISVIDESKEIGVGTVYYDKDTKAVDTDVLDANGNFSKTGSFYREVIIPLKQKYYATTYDFSKGTKTGVSDQYVNVNAGGEEEGATVTYLQEVDVIAQQGKGNAPDKHTYTGVPITELNTTSDYTLTNSDGTVNLSSGVTFGTNYYPTAQDAVAGTNEIANADTNGDFDNAGDYYRTVTFTVNPDDVDKYDFTDEFNDVKPVVTTVNGVTTVMYVQHIHVDKNVATATITHEKVVADSNITDVPQPDPTVNTLLDKNIQPDTQEGHTVVTNDGKDVTADNSQYYDSNNPESYDPNNTSKYVINGKFTKAGIYYRRITFNLISGVSAADEFKGKDVVLVSKTDNSVTYLQPVDVILNTAVANVVGASATAGQSVTDAKVDTDGTSDITYTVGGTTGSIVDSISYGDSYYQNATDFMNGVSPVGKTFTTSRDFYRVITFKLKANALEGNTLDDDIHTTTTNTDGTVSVSYAQAISVGKSSAKPNIAGTKAPISVPAGSSVSGEQTGESNTVTGVTSDGTEGLINDGTVSFGTDYYSTADTNNTVATVLAGTANKTDGVISGDSYIKPGTYYRTVTVPLKEGSNLANSFDPTTSKLSEDGKSVTYAQTITIGSLSVKGNADAISVTAGTKTDDSKLTSTTGYTLTNGDNTVDATVSVDSTHYYKSAADALAGKNEVTLDSFVDSTATYYRVVTFTPAAGTIDEYTTTDPNTRVNLDKGTVTYAQAITVEKSAAEPNIAGTTTSINVDSGSSVSGEQGKEKNGIDGINADGTKGSIVNGTISFGTDYYSTADTNNTVATVLAGTANKTDGVVYGDSYIKPGTYYRTVTVPLKKGANLANSFEPTTSKPSADGKSVTYVQTITINANKATIKADNPISATAGESITSLPAVDGYTLNVAGDKVSAKVRTDNKIYKSFSNKVLSDELKGNEFPSAGTYYRVITFTPTDASEYTFDDPSVISNENGVITYVQAITVDTTSAKVNSTEVSATVGDKASSLTTAANATLTTDSGNVEAEVTVGKAVYRSSTGALTKNSKDEVNTFDDTNAYYRVITFKPKDGNAKQYSFDDENVKISADGTTITYAQPITVKPKSGTKGIQIGPDVANKTVKVDISSVGINKDLELTDGYTLKDGDNSLIDTSVPNGGIGFSAEYYELADATKSNPTVDDLGAKVDSSIANLYTITKPNDYYRKVIFNVTPETIKNYDFSSIYGKVVGNTVVFVKKISALKNRAYANISTPSVSYNTSANSSSLKVPTGVTLQDDADKNINSGTPELSGIFSTEDAAKNATSDTGDVTGNLQDGPYYQRVTFLLSDNDSNAYDFGDGVVAKDGKSVTYIRTITVKPNSGGSSGNSGNNSGSDADNNGSGDEDEWTYYKDPGVVTTKMTRPSYSLNNRANETVENRALAQDTSWITDQYRTNKAGVKQYRVATGEWIDSNDVYFRENSTGNNGDDDWTYYNNPGVVTTKTTQPSYSLNNRANETVENRALAQDTSWITDQYRTNKAGVKQYRVATGEWIDSHDVVFNGQTTDEEDGWTYYKDPGIVVTKPDQEYYSLNNRANDTIKNRALMEKTSWITDQYRTNRQGVKQYRVATNEWIDSHDVIFTKNVKQIVNVDETAPYYSLYTIYGQLVQNRALEQETSWFSDKVAYADDGTVYYRVATNEWVKQIDGVHLASYAWYKY
ncbi:hypothetical protein [Companilactobacillus sp. FL22-1]|uniref:hypothetical protein n=1 Tax=Companilactobacillus sp. FL22-1 TaxID=3373892 RepID=UPI00375540BA